MEAHMVEEEEEASLVEVAASMGTIVAVAIAMEEMEEEEEGPLMEVLIRITNLELMKGMERSSSPTLVTS